MALDIQMSNFAVNAQADAITPHAASGKLRVYSGSKPATADTALGAQVMLQEFVLNATAFGAAVAGVLTANAISNITNAATGTAAFFRLFKSDGTTVLWDGTVGTSGCDMNINSVAISSGATGAVSSFTHTVTK